MSASSIVTASDIQMDYMKLLITQLQNQNPLEPLDNNEMASQLAQFAGLSQLESMNSQLGTMNTSFVDVLAATNRTYANSLLGKNVTFYSEDETAGELVKMTGTVESVFNEPNNGGSLLGVAVGEGEEKEEYTLGLGAVILVEE